MGIVSEFAKMQIRDMERGELLRTYGKLIRYNWPEELGPKPWIWGRGEVLRASPRYRHIYYCTAKIRTPYLAEIERELGEREIKRIKNEAEFIGGKKEYFII